MVSYKQILASNALVNPQTLQTAVFVGGTSGIGKLTIKALVSTGIPIKIYLIGRPSSQANTQPFIDELQTINSKASIIWISAEVSLLADVKRVCETIKTSESRIDLLFLSAGYAPFGPRRETAEGHEVVQALEYYSRTLFALHLLPLLNRSEHARVVSVLAGGFETTYLIDLDDFDLKKKGAFKVWRARPQYVALTTITMDRLAKENPGVTFIHSRPGAVNTGNVRRGWAGGSSFVGGALTAVIEFLTWLVGFSNEESAQRHLFESTSAAFGGRGTPWTGTKGVATAGGLFLVSDTCECTPNSKVVDVLRGKQEALWEHTQTILGPYL
ncbi:hypothetical protein OQA88_9350 [Cercophora sp. LCS_1]